MMKPLEILVHWYENLSPQTLDEIGSIYAENARFRDPFNDVAGVAAIRAIFAHMFATTQMPAFVVTECFEDGPRAVLLWRFTFAVRGRSYEIEGASHLVFSEAGLVVAHRDYWDSSEELLQKLPVIGAPLRWLKRRFTASG
jgi:ketosteroid isomerase-like protein